MSPVAAFRTPSEPLPDELDDVFREHARLVYRTAYSVTGSAQDAEDVVQTLFLQLLRRGFPPEFGKNPKGYLYRAAVNLSLNAVRSLRRRAAAVDAARVAHACQVVNDAAGPNPEGDLRERLVAAMAQLSPRAVEMLVLRYEHNCSEADIGKLLGTSRGVVAVTLLPGTYVMKFLVRDREVGRIGTYQTRFTVPNLNREPTRLPISSVVLGSQRMPVNDALYSVKTADRQSIGHPLIEGGRKLLPSVTRVFSASRELYVYVEAYEQYAPSIQPLVAVATF